MPYQVKLHRDVVRELASLQPNLRSGIVERLRTLEQDPYTARAGVDILRLRGTKGREDLFRLKVGDYRAIYAVQGETIYVTDFFHRGRGYINYPSPVVVSSRTAEVP